MRVEKAPNSINVLYTTPFALNIFTENGMLLVNEKRSVARSTSKPGIEGTTSPFKKSCATHDKVPIVYYYLLRVCCEGNFGIQPLVQLKVVTMVARYTGCS